MNNFIKQVIEEKFASKAQQRYFYAQASKGGKKGKKWAKLADEFSSKTNFKNIPDKVENKEETDKSAKNQFKKDIKADKDYVDFKERAKYVDDTSQERSFGVPNVSNEDPFISKKKYGRVGKVEKEVDEIVDDKGNIKRSNISTAAKRSTTTSKETTDKVVQTGTGAMGMQGGVNGIHPSVRYWGTLWESNKNIEEIEMDSALGYDDTLGADATYEEALKHFVKNLGIPEDEAKERLEAMGYIPDQKDLVRLVENPKTYIKDYIESVLVNKGKDSDIIDNDKDDTEINPLVLKQLQSLKKTLSKNNIPLEKIINHLKSE